LEPWDHGVYRNVHLVEKKTDYLPKFVRLRFSTGLLDLKLNDDDEKWRRRWYLARMKRLFGLEKQWPTRFVQSGCAEELAMVDTLVSQAKTPSMVSFLRKQKGTDEEIDFAVRMLQIDPEERWAAGQLLAHDWLRS
jgi:serine/threonine protein kinase